MALEFDLYHEQNEVVVVQDYRERFPLLADDVDSVYAEAIQSRRLGDYQLLEVIGEGGMGVVYRARHIMLGQVVALKVLPERLVGYPGLLSRFRREIASIGPLNHSNIVRAHNAGESKGTHFLVMEYVDGVDFEKLIRQHHRLPIGAACELVRQAACGLQYAHEHGLVHRDIKPANLILDRTGTVKLLDLGLVRIDADLHQGHQSGGRLTGTNITMGTVEYMAPETV